jgi:transcriptional regulator GlxA family with amidase domain
MTRQIVFLALPGMQLLDLAGPADVFAASNECLRGRGQEPAYRMRFTGPIEEPDTATGVGLRVGPLSAIRGPIDTLVVPGGMSFGEAVADPRASAWIRRRWRRTRRVVSICSGAFVLADAGVLDGRRITTHWRELDRLGEVVPNATIEKDALYVKDGSVYTSAGITAGIDLALALVEEDLGPEIAIEVARVLVMFLHRPGGQSQFSAALRRPRAEHPGIRAVQADVMENPGNDHRVPELARRAGMSTRHFVRVFTQETGEPPARHVQRVRLERARQLLEREGLGLEEVAAACGFGSAETMRRCFHESVGVSPSEYRARFSRAQPAWHRTGSSNARVRD